MDSYAELFRNTEEASSVNAIKDEGKSNQKNIIFPFDEDSMDIEAEIVNLNSGGTSIPKYDKNINCDICSSSMNGEYVLKLNCNHDYHRNCILKKIIIEEKVTCVSCEKSKVKNVTCAVCLDNFPEEPNISKCAICKYYNCPSCKAEAMKDNSNFTCYICKETRNSKSNDKDIWWSF